MAMPDLLPADSEDLEWEATAARLVVTDPAALGPAHRLVQQRIAAVERACSRRRPDAEIHRLDRAAGRAVRVSPLLAELVAAALTAANRTDGDVDPTVTRSPISPLGLQRDLSVLPVCGSSIRPRSMPRWRRVRLAGRSLTLPPGITLDLSAIAPRFAADRCAAEVAQRLGTGVLVGLAGDVATAGPAPLNGWPVPLDGGSGAAVTLCAGAALATAHRPVKHGPGSGPSVDAVWRTVSVLAFSCLEAGTYSQAALVRGTWAPSWLRSLGVPARLVTTTGDVITVGEWPGPGR